MEFVEILPLDYEPAPAGGVDRLAAQQDAVRAAKNEAGLLAWHEREFGPVAGPQLCGDYLGRLRAAGL